MSAIPAEHPGGWTELIKEYAGSKDNLPINIRDFPFYAKTDGTDQSSIFAQAYSLNRPIYAGTGTYTFTSSPFIGARPVTILGDGPGLTIFDLINAPLAQIGGSINSDITVTVNVAVGDTTLTLSSTSGLSSGDYLILKDANQVLVGTAASPYDGRVGEVVRILSVDSATVISLHGSIEQAMTVAGANVTVRKMNLVNGVQVKNLTLRNPFPGTFSGGNARGIALNIVKKVRVENVEFTQLDDDGLNLKSVVDWRAINCDFNDMTNTGGRTPYGVIASNATVDGLMDNCRQREGRHMFTTGGDNGEIGPAHILVKGSQGCDSNGTPFDTHPAGRQIVFENCEVHGCRINGFLIRSPDTQVINPTVVGAQIGVHLNGSATRSIVRGGKLTNLSVNGILVDAEDCRIVGKPLIEARDYGIRFLSTLDTPGTPAMTKAFVDDIDVINNPTVSALTFQGAETVTKVWDNIRAPNATTQTVPGMPTITSAANLVLPIIGKLVNVAAGGVVVVTSITPQAGRIVTLRLAAGLTITDGGNLFLNGNYVTTSNDTLTLVSDGINWYEIARSVN